MAETKANPPCTQCHAAPIMCSVQGHHLCLSCATKFESMLASQASRRDTEFRQQAATLNFLSDQMGHFLPGMTRPRLNLPPAAVHAQHIDQSITVDRSVVGAINTGTIRDLTVSLDKISQTAGEDVAAQVRELVTAVTAAMEFSATDRQQILEHLTAISEQAARPPESRQTSVLGSLKTNLDRWLTPSAKCASLWSAICATLRLTGLGA